MVLAAIKMFAPSLAAFSAMAFPIPRLAPVINSVLPANFLSNKKGSNLGLLKLVKVNS